MKVISRIIHGLRERGMINALKALYSKYWFEIKYGIKMNPSNGKDGRKTGIPLERGHVHYEPVCHFSFNRMLQNLDWDFGNSTFLDYGCGKGAAIILASRYGFKKYLGVEYNPELVKECRSNILKFTKISKRELDCEIICTDATRYVVPADVNVVYFFNPFDDTLLDLVLQNIEQSVKNSQRNILLFYFNALHKDVIEKYGYTVVYNQEVDKINIWYKGGNYAYKKHAVTP